MNRILSETNVKKARKDYPCDACWFLLETYGKLQIFINEFSWRLTPKELYVLRKAEISNYKILKGEPYYKQAAIYDGDFQEFKAIPEIHEICQKYGIYDGEE